MSDETNLPVGVATTAPDGSNCVLLTLPALPEGAIHYAIYRTTPEPFKIPPPPVGPTWWERALERVGNALLRLAGRRRRRDEEQRQKVVRAYRYKVVAYNHFGEKLPPTEGTP